MKNEIMEGIKKKYETDDMHLLVPSVYVDSPNPFYSLSAVSVTVDRTFAHHEIYKVGSEKRGREFVDLYALAKPALERMAAAAGISIVAPSSYTRMLDEDRVIGHVEAALLTPDGSPRLMANEKVIDMKVARKMMYTQKKGALKYGLAGSEAFNVSKLYAGKWKEVQSKQTQKTQNRFFIDKKDEEAYLTSAVDTAMLQLWKDAPQKAWTGAWLRVIRSALNLRPTYTLDELNKPFVVIRLNFKPDYSNPTVRQMALEQGFRSMGMLFQQNQPPIQMPASGYSEVPPASNQAAEAPKQQTAEMPTPAKSEPVSEKPEVLHCAACGKAIHGKDEASVKNYAERSKKAFGKILCPACAKKEKAAQKPALGPYEFVCTNCGVVFDMSEYAKKYHATREQIEGIFKDTSGGPLCQSCLKKAQNQSA